MNDLSGRHIMLVGGAGFIGHRLALALKERGADVTVIDSLQVNNLLSFRLTGTDVEHREVYIDMIQQRLDMLHNSAIPLLIQDARDYHAVCRLVEETQPDTIIHLAAVSHAGKSNKDPYSTFDHSLRTLENALDASRGHIKHFVYFSSSMVYGNFQSDHVVEESPCEPLGIYGALKYSGEKIVIAYNQVFDLPYTIVRPSALYGERCVSRRVGQVFIENALKGQDITVDGDGSGRLDFTYIEDLCHGVVQMLTHEAALNQTFNLTYGEGRSVAQMLEILKEHFPDVCVKFVERDRLTPERGTLKVDKARELIGYEPSWPLEKGFPKYIDWYKKSGLFREA